ncbi:605_t:CDS:2, partial [Acaulospora colombiana]
INVINVLNRLKDAHTGLSSDCYSNFIFVQGMDLYSTVDSRGEQSIKVWKDFVDDTNSDCDVLQIDGLPALQAIKQYADKEIGLVRDIGVRFNVALTSLSADGTSEFSNYFSRRQYLPPTDEISYTLKCKGSKKTVKRTWTACGISSSIESVTDPETYWNKNCLPAFSNTRQLYYRKISTTLKTQKRPTSPTTDNICRIIGQDEVLLNKAQLLINLDSVGFYHLKKKKKIGVLTMSSVRFGNLMPGFQKFIDKGVKKVILDLTNNDGGYIIGAHYFNNLLFPQTDPYFETDFRVSELMRLSIQKSSSSDFITYPGIWVDPQTKKPFKDATKFIGNNIYTRGGVSGSYTSRFIGPKGPSSKINLPWKAEDYVILTNGFCGSSCSFIATHLAEENNVATVSVGGLFNTPMAYASFTGGQEYQLNSIIRELERLGLSNNPLAPSHLPISAGLNFVIREAYSRSDPNEVLEFLYRPATKRLYYDSKSARDPSELWAQVADML